MNNKEKAKELAIKYCKDIDDNGNECYNIGCEIACNEMAEWQRRQMMKDAIDAEICKKYSTNQLCVTSEPFESDIFKFGDNVKIIIVRED